MGTLEGMSKAAEAFGRKLRMMRVLRGLSQQELAERSGLSRNAISSFERAERFPRGVTIDALVHGLRTDADTMVGDLLAVRERSSEAYAAGNPPAGGLRDLAGLLKDRPERIVRLVRDIAVVLVSELAASLDPAPPPD